MRRDYDIADAARRPGAIAWLGAITPHAGGFLRIRRGVRASALALRRETLPPD